MKLPRTSARYVWLWFTHQYFMAAPWGHYTAILADVTAEGVPSWTISGEPTDSSPSTGATPQ